MVGLGWGEILILLVLTGMFCGAPVLIAVIFFIMRSARSQPPATASQAPRATATPPDDIDARRTIVARLTQRFCPQCRSSLAPDSPEGLCPACLMAEGLGSGVLDPAEAGMAATTPPSGSRPPATGQWADLQRHFPDLEILELFGRGGMGSVYKARQKNLDRIVALKVIPPDAAKDPAFTERFGREARAMARLNHPNIVTVYNFGHEGELCWLLMEYVDGVNLRHTLRASRLAPREALAIVPQICDALQYAHDQGVVHRDIKPENVLLDRSGRVKIADFGLAKLLGKGPDDFTLTGTQQVMGTPRYMAPEQIEKPATVDHRADIYSLGVVIYEMLTGELPLGRFEPPSHSVEIDVRIDQVVMRALEKSPERRYQRASEVKTDLASAASWPAGALTSLLAGEEPATPAPVWRTPAPASKSNPTDYPDHPGGVPLGQVLLVASGMVVGVVLMTAGLAMALYVMTWGFHGFSDEFWGWMGAAFGCIGGGFGSAAGSYNTYRQMAGAVDVMRSPHVTWFDWVLRGYLLLGILLLLAGLIIAGEPAGQSFPGFLLFGGIATVQAACFLIWRMPFIAPSIVCRKLQRSSVVLSDRSQFVPRNSSERNGITNQSEGDFRQSTPSTKRPESLDPARQAMRDRVAGPAIGLIVVGVLGIVPLLLAALVMPTTVQMSPVQSETSLGLSLRVATSPAMLVPLFSAPTSAATANIAAALLPLPPLAQRTMFETSPQTERPVFFMPILILAVVLNLAHSATLIIGGWQMRQAKSYGLSLIASILAVLPCTVTWVIGLPIGIWAISILTRSDVREGFET